MSRGTVPPDEPRPAFRYVVRRRGLLRRPQAPTLECEQVALAALAEKYGTPLYVYSAAVVRSRLRAFDRAFRHQPHTLCYSVKANSNLALLRLLHSAGCGFDVVSGGELERVLHVHPRAARDVVFSGVGKTRAELRSALRAGIRLFNVESEAELIALAETAAQARQVAPLALRVNPDVPARTHPYISTGLHEHKFGIPIDQAYELYKQAFCIRYLKVEGVSIHIGSQISDPAPFESAMERVAELVRRLRQDGHRIRYVDAGGGLGIDYDGEAAHGFEASVEAYSRALTAPLRKLKVHLLLEPGRAIVGPAGVLLTRVLYRKTNGEKKFVVVDAAMTDLLRPALYGARHQVVPVERPGPDASPETVDVVGPVCETGDFLARDCPLPPVAADALLAVLDAGAYGMVLASNYNTRPRAAEVLVDGRNARLVRRRETVDELLRAETF